MRSYPHRSPPTRRGGYGLIEMAITGALLAVMALLCAQVTARVASQRLTTSRREAAARLAANLVEEARALPWDRLTTDQATTLAAALLADSPPLAAARATVSVAVTPAPSVGETEARRVVVTVAWPDPTRGAGAPVRLVAWVYGPIAPAGGQPR